MPSGITGDFGKLRGWQELFENGEVLLEATSQQLAEETIGLIKQGFRSETDPYGDKWTPKQKHDGRKTLSGKTSRLKGGWHVVRADKRGFSAAPSVPYAAPHQAPRFNRRPRRMMVPTASKGLPPDWSHAYEEAATELMRSYFGGAGGGGGGMNFIAAKIAGVRRGISRKTNLKEILMRAARAASSGE